MGTPEADLPMLAPAPIIVNVDSLHKHLDTFVAELKKASDAHGEWDRSVAVSDNQKGDKTISPDVHDEVLPRFTDFFKTWTTFCKVSESKDKVSSPQVSMEILLPHLYTIFSANYRAPTSFTDLEPWTARCRHLAQALTETTLRKGSRATVVKRYSTGVAKSLMTKSEAWSSLRDMAYGLDGLTVDALKKGFAAQKYRAYLGEKLQDAYNAAYDLSSKIDEGVVLSRLFDEGRKAYRTMLDLLYAVAIAAPDPAPDPNPGVRMTDEEEKYRVFLHERIGEKEIGDDTEWGEELSDDESYDKVGVEWEYDEA